MTIEQRRSVIDTIIRTAEGDDSAEALGHGSSS